MKTLNKKRVKIPKRYTLKYNENIFIEIFSIKVYIHVYWYTNGK